MHINEKHAELTHDAWNELKKKLETATDQPRGFPKEGEVWMCSLGKNIGYEQNGTNENFSRPVLIVKKFNNHIFWSVPLSEIGERQEVKEKAI
jgi:mRNA interferase MazF